MGKKIRVWHDEWIPGTQTRKILSPRGDANPNTMVCDLIHPISKTWIRSLISQLFLPFEVERVMSIPISSRLPEDVMCWDLEKDGVYSVRSAYKAIWGDLHSNSEASSSYSMALWKKIWKVQVLPRVKIFAWRALSNALPTNVAIHRRVPSHGTVCSVCGQADEDAIHALYYCQFAQEVWRLSNVGLVWGDVGGSVADWWPGGQVV